MEAQQFIPAAEAIAALLDGSAARVVRCLTIHVVGEHDHAPLCLTNAVAEAFRALANDGYSNGARALATLAGYVQLHGSHLKMRREIVDRPGFFEPEEVVHLETADAELCACVEALTRWAKNPPRGPGISVVNAL